MKLTEKRIERIFAGVDEHYGGCPKCGGHRGFGNIREDHWFFCEVHRFKWRAATNQFGSWLYENREDWQRNRNFLKDFAEVKPVHSLRELLNRNARTHTQAEPNSGSGNELSWLTVDILYHVTLANGLDGWGQEMRWDPDALCRACEQAIRERHEEAFIDVGHEACEHRPDVYTLQIDDIQVFFSFEHDHILIRGFGYECLGESRDDFDGGGFFS